MIYICVRETTDWSDEAVFRAQLPALFTSTIELWNGTFNIPYHLFRHRLREIARINLAAVRNAVCMDWNNVPAGELVLPVDDDDWFSDEVGLLLEQARDAAPNAALDAYRWESSFLEVPINLGHQLYLIKRRLLHTAPKWICTTNNYAIVKALDRDLVFRSHVKASGWFHQHPEKFGLLDARLSLMNRTLASRTSLRLMPPPDFRQISRATLLRKYRQYKELYARPPGPGLEWSRPYLRMMEALMRELLPSAHIGGASR